MTEQEYHLIRTIDQHAIDEATETFSAMNRIMPGDLYSSKRDRPLVETRTMIWAYLRQNSTLTMQNLGALFNRHHTTVIASLKVHKRNIDVFSNGRRVNELYTRKYLEGSEVLNQVMRERKQTARDLRYRVVLYTDNPSTLNYYEIMSVKDMSE
jgi:hypothetical protein